jgi:hypothetical protein
VQKLLSNEGVEAHCTRTNLHVCMHHKNAKDKYIAKFKNRTARSLWGEVYEKSKYKSSPKTGKIFGVPNSCEIVCKKLAFPT